MTRVLTEIVPSSDGQHSYQPWQTARYAAEGSDTGYLSDLDIFWDWADQHNNLGLALRYVLIAASLRSRSGNLTPELLVQLVQVGTLAGAWSAAAALETVAHMPEPERQTECLAALLKAGIELPWPRAIEAARAITAAGDRARALAALAPQLASAHGNNPALFATTLRDLARRGRPALLGDLAALAPWIVALAGQLRQPELPATLAQHIVETARCWP